MTEDFVSVRQYRYTTQVKLILFFVSDLNYYVLHCGQCHARLIEIKLNLRRCSFLEISISTNFTTLIIIKKLYDKRDALFNFLKAFPLQ